MSRLKNETLFPPLRVFVSYARKDRDTVTRLVKKLSELGLSPWIDESTRPGMRFTHSIQDAISRSHLFIPLITKNSVKRPWVHQETGYAVGVDVPVLPIALNSVAKAMINEIQAITVDEEFDNLMDELKKVDLSALVDATHERLPIRQVADYTEQRTERLVQYANHFARLGKRGDVRQRAVYSSFSLPDRSDKSSDKKWKRYPEKLNNSQFLRDYLEQEREALTKHFEADDKKCYLLINPFIDGGAEGHPADQVRIEVLREFLEECDHRYAGKVDIVVSKKVKEGNLTLIGDMFAANAVLPRPGVGYGHTVFTTHGPSVYRLVRKFDAEFERLEATRKLKGDTPCKYAIRKLDQLLEQSLKGQQGAPKSKKQKRKS